MSTTYGALEGLPMSKADLPKLADPQLRPRGYAQDLIDPDLPELPEEQNGPWGTLGQIVNTMIGSGILAMPSVLAQVGLAYTTGMLIFFCAIVGASSLMMIDAGLKLGVMDYSLIVERSLGRRWRLANDCAVFVANMGALLSYMNVIGSLGKRVAEFVQPHGWELLNTYPGFMVIFITVLVLPMNMKRSYGDLTYISASSVVFILSATLFVGIQGPVITGVTHAIPIAPAGALYCLKNLGNFAYGTSCQQVVCEAHLSIVPESKDSFRAVMWMASAAGGLLLLGMGIAGYVAFGETVSSNVLMSFSPGLSSCICMSLVVTHLLLYIPNDFIIMRFFGFKLMDVNITQVPTIPYVLATVFLFAVPLVLMAIVPYSDVSGVFGLVLDLTGDLPIGFQCFLIPGLVYCRQFRLEASNWPMYASAVLTSIVGAVCMLVCPVIDITSYVNACHSPRGCSSY